jgi:hypothetical protein
VRPSALRCSLLLTLLVLALGAAAAYAIWAFPAPFGGEAVRQLKAIGVMTVGLVVAVYFITYFILMFVGVEQTREAAAG